MIWYTVYISVAANLLLHLLQKILDRPTITIRKAPPSEATDDDAVELRGDQSVMLSIVI